MAEGEGKTEWHYFSGCEQGDQKTSQVYACENNGENISAISNWNTSFWEGKKLIKIVKVFLPALAKVEDTVQIESHKSPQAFWLICKAGGSLARKKKVTRKCPYYAGCKGFSALFVMSFLRDSSSAQWSISIDL